ncbi:3'-5' exonuclease [Thalassotalea insulae]|uniref:3'-5' exonuclease n=1 Tax=Thalassotalea insulae TaxID=2056778 RepID=A0ABQ6GVX5_9GAMM|nr:exonuclease domain-containing protein [Thalassotalea insulae]GLX78321.1 3'-5' exonuclease [Thalassotalea insulae]
MLRYHPLFNWLLGYEVERKRDLLRAPAGPLKDFLAVAFPSPTSSLAQSNILAVDFETTGLDAVQDKLLSIGFVELHHRQIHLGSCHHQVINTEQKLSADNVAIHQITNQQQQQGVPLQVAVEKLLKALAGKVMLVHFARIEREFLQQACLELYGIAPSFPIIDTLAIAKRRLDKKDIAYDPSQLRLATLRTKYHLPPYGGHNALNDAIATAELFLAQTRYYSDSTQLKQLLL